MHYLIVMVAAFLAGIINSVAGGGTLLTFPSLLAAGVLPVAANATSTVALVPASVSAWWGYREEKQGGWQELAWLSVPSIVGGLAGALLVLKAGNSLFSRLVPWLILGATVLFIVQEPLRRWLSTQRRDAEEKPAWPMIALFQVVVAVYGGFFGAGIGIMMLASLGIAGMSNIHQMNRLKNFAAVCINGVAAGTFILEHQVVQWPFVALMLAGSVPGGYAGAWVARKVGQANVRRAVIFIGLAIGVYMLLQQTRSML